ncbi:hypothetical protein QJV45_14335 [Listeria booriae]|uniref:hypothetical protein n=1 Tax=Listeria booriae TaxID=1552123 RepID=UPI0028807DE5|nr:hypothetical protein [Listeria booriae]MDT0111658.1 hypothetical protein [Listeria booriae]
MTEEFYKIEKGDKFYEDVEKIHYRDEKAFSKEVSELLGFEAIGNIGFNRKQLLVKKSALEKFKPEWVSLFKRGGGEYLTPKVSQKQLVEDYGALRKKYNMDINFSLLLLFSRFRGAAELIYDFDNSGFVYMEMDREQGEEVRSKYTPVTELEFAERKLESLKYRGEEQA